MPSEQTPAYEIGHFNVENMALLLSPGVKYVVSRARHDAAYVLHADEKEAAHLHVAIKAGVEPATVLGGGNIAWSSKGSDLRGSSHRFGEEPEDVRRAFNGIVNELLRGKIEAFIQERLAARK